MGLGLGLGLGLGIGIGVRVRVRVRVMTLASSAPRSRPVSWSPRCHQRPRKRASSSGSVASEKSTVGVIGSAGVTME